MNDRHISINIRLILDLLDYSDLINEEAIILFLDFYKAFDTVEHLFINEALIHFVFGEDFRKMVHTLYRNISSSVSFVNHTSPHFDIKRGIRQECPISSFLFLIAAELINLYTVHCTDTDGVKIGNFNCNKLPLKLANFHKQALEAWKIAFKYNFSPHSCIIWNNQHILFRNESMYIKKNGLIKVFVVFIFVLDVY